MGDIPSISIIIPTYNSARTLELCLNSIATQIYPQENIEIIIADAGSVDGTLELIDKFKSFFGHQNFKVINNPLRTAEAGKAVGLKHVSKEIIGLIDSDNVLPDKNWLQRMVEPFNDPEIIATEPIEYTYRKTDGFITRYCALIGMNDPLCMYLGNYDRYNNITGRWTEMPVVVQDKGSFLKVQLDPKRLPTIGANGFLIRRVVLTQCEIKDYLFDIDILYELLEKSPNLKIAKVKIGIVHIFSGRISTFIRKQNRRIKDFLYFSKAKLRKYPWKNTDKMKILKFIIYCITVIPLLLQSLKGLRRRPDAAWFFHAPACWITLCVYGWGTLQGIVRPSLGSRKRWSQ
jgi:glycosyltransferase involved in cell wall biosynthesis